MSSRHLPRYYLADPMPPNVLDELDRAIFSACDPLHRALLLRDLLYELYDSTAWLGESDPLSAELRSLRLVLDAADAHHERQWAAGDGSNQLPFEAAS